MFHNFFKDTNVDFDKSSVINNSNEIFVKAFFIQDEYKCPVCDCSILVKNGHCKKRVKHCIYYTKIIIVECNFQIYKCLNCGHLFQEKNSFSPKGLSFSYESIFAILECIRKPNETFESIAKSFHISRQNVIDIFDRFYTYTPSSMLPSIISFDEKHIGKAITDHKYLFIMFDWKTKKIYDILPSRDKNTLSKYFCSLSRESRHNVSYVTMDMWESYRDIAKKTTSKC